MSLKTEQEVMQRKFRLILNRVKDSYHLYDKELALVMGVSSGDAVRKMRNGDIAIHACRMVTLCQNLIKEYNDSSLLDHIIPEGYMVTVHKITENDVPIMTSLNGISITLGDLYKEEQNGEEVTRLAKEVIQHSTSIINRAG